jgi:hypothetical protein
VVNEYEKRLQEMSFVPRSSYGLAMLREDGDPNRNFLTYVSCDQGFAMKVLKDVGMLPSKVQRSTCGRHISWSAEPIIHDRYTWRCRKNVAGVKCYESMSIKQDLWFQHSHLTFHELLLITYNIKNRQHVPH